MSDYSVVDEKARLYDMAVEQGLVPPDWDGTPPARQRSRDEHHEHHDHQERAKK